MRRGAVLALLPAVALAPAACGGVKAADLLLVERSGSTAGAHLTLLVDEEGVVHCNGGPALKVSDPQLVQARAIQEELEKPAGEGLKLPPRPGSVLSYTVHDEQGTVRFSDNSAGQPKVLRQLALYVLQVAQQVCRLPE